MFCVLNGVPYDVAFNLEPVDLMAHVIVLGELQPLGGNEWDFDLWRWKDRT